MVSRSYSQGGPYSSQCGKCSDRHYKHPLTIAEHAHAADCAVSRRWNTRLNPGYVRADLVLYDLGLTGHENRTKMNRLIEARKAKRARLNNR